MKQLVFLFLLSCVSFYAAEESSDAGAAVSSGGTATESIQTDETGGGGAAAVTDSAVDSIQDEHDRNKLEMILLQKAFNQSKGDITAFKDLLGSVSDASIRAFVGSVSDRGKTPLYFACEKNHSDWVKLLLEYSDDAVVNKPDDRDKNSPLLFACAFNNREIFTLLFDRSDSVIINRADKFGRTALSVACDKNNLAMVKSLLERSDPTTINRVDGSLETALFHVCRNNNIDIFRLLLPYCIETTINQLNYLGETALSWAYIKKNKEMVDTLLPRCTPETIERAGETIAQEGELQGEDFLWDLQDVFGSEFPAGIVLKYSNDEEIEHGCGVVKIPALNQRSAGRTTLSCSFYALYFADLLIKSFEADHASPLEAEWGELFQNRDYFYKHFLAEFRLDQDFNDVDQHGGFVSDQQVEANAERVNPKITVVHLNKNVKRFLKNYQDYQVLIFNKHDHWITFGVDYRKGKIYLVDSLENYKKQNYSSLDRKIIQSIHEQMVVLSDAAGHGGFVFLHRAGDGAI